MAVKQNLNYPLLLNKENFATFSSTNYSVTTDATVTSNSFPFVLDWGSTAYDSKLNIGSINDTVNDTENSYNYIDLLVNNKTITEIANYINEQTNKDYTKDSLTYYLLYENLYSAIRFTTILNSQDIYENVNNSLDQYNILYDTEFSKYLYRARKDKNIIIENGEYYFEDSHEFVPIFSVVSSDPNLQCYLYIRNIPILFKRWLSSKKNNMYNYIFIAPNYILQKYSQFVTSIKKIKFMSGDNIFNNNLTIFYSSLTESILLLNEVLYENILLTKTTNTFNMNN